MDFRSSTCMCTMSYSYVS